MGNSKIEYNLTETGGRRLGMERRSFSYDLHLPERRDGQARRIGKDRRSGKDLRDGTERRSGRDRRSSPVRAERKNMASEDNVRVAKLADVL
jgi:hypothetical protein